MSLKEYISQESFEEEQASLLTPQGKPDASVHLTVDSTPELDTAAKGVEDTAGEMEALQDATASCEAYADLLRKYEHEGLSPASAHLIQLGLQRHAKVLKKNMAEEVSVEAFRGAYSKRNGLRITVGGIEFNLSELAKQIREVLKKAGEMARQLYLELTQNVDGLRSKLNTIHQQLKGTHFSAPSNDYIEIKNASSLMIGTKFAGQDLTSVMQMAQILTTDYPVAADNYLSHLARILKRYPGTPAKECWAEMVAIEGPASKYSRYQAGKPVLYPGNAFFASGAGERSQEDSSFDMDSNRGNAHFGQGLCVGWDKSAHAESYQRIKVDSKQGLLSRISQFDRLLNLMERVKDGGGKIANGYNAINQALDHVEKQAETADDAADAEKLIRRLGRVSTITGVENSKAYRYLWRTAAAFLKVIQAEAMQFGIRD